MRRFIPVVAALAISIGALGFSRWQQDFGLTEQQSGTTATLVAVSAVSEDVVWVAGQQGTFVRTTDGGATWKAGKVAGAERMQFRDVYAVDADTAYLLSIGNGSASRIYKTANGGVDWTLQYTNPDTAAFYDCFDFWDADRGIVIGDAIQGRTIMLQTTSGGKTWEPIPYTSLPRALPGEGSYASSGTCLIARSGGHAWVSTTKSRVLHTTNYGRTWTVATTPISVVPDSTGAPSISMRDVRRGAVFGGFGAKPGDVLMAITNDGGATWEDRRRPPIRGGVWAGAYVPGPQSTTIVVVGSTGSAFTRNEGTSWTLVDTAFYWGLDFASPNAGWAVGSRGRIVRFRF
ncbi:MAG TPA: hypothetical protein VJR92_15910 [Gemmatimonadaceae bacterium]|nr:hypothetical protein [Gemmatimonadaceae bacterium]